MAEFNPRINPTNDPNYENRSRPIDIPDSIRPRGVEANQILPKGQEIGDRSAEYEGKSKAYGYEAEGVSQKGYGDLFAGVVGIGDFMAKAGVQMVRKDIEDKVYKVADEERQKFTLELEQIKSGVKGKNLLDSNAQMSEDTPDEVAELPETLSSLTGAMEAGKISKAGYTARLLAAAKDLRSRYPGFKNEIDQEFSKVTGMNPANAYITSLVTDINRQNATQNSEKNKTLNFIRSKVGFEGSEDAYQKVESGEWGPKDVIKWAAPQERLRLRLSDRAAMFNDKKLTLEENQRAGKEVFDAATSVVVQARVDNLMRRIGISSEADVADIDARTKTGAITPKQWNDFGDLWANENLNLRATILREAREKGITRVLGIEEVNKRTDAVMDLMKQLGERITNKDTGGIHKTARAIKALGDEDQARVLSDSEIGPPMRMIETIKRIGGEQFLQQENLRKLTNGLSGKFQVYQEQWIQTLQTQTDMATSNVPKTLNRAFDEFKVKMKDATPAEKKKMNASMIDEITRIADPKVPDEVKVNYAAAAFHPDNRGFISRLNVDSYDSTGKPIEGQAAIFQKMTTPEMTKELKRLGERYPEVWKNYTNWATETLSNELLSKDMRYLSEITNPSIKVGWDPDNKRLVPTYNNQQGPDVRRSFQGRTPDREFEYVERMINRINNGMGNYKNIAIANGAQGQDIDGFILGTIARAVGPEALTKVDNIPADIIRNIGLTQLKKKDGSSNQR